MVKTTIYLPDELKRRLEQAARDRATSEAEVIRAALDAGVPPLERPRPTFPLFNSGQPIKDWDEAMRGFGQD
jgi:plasmid stability protein